VVGVELDPAYVRQGARNHPSISFVQASATRLPLRDRTVDAVTCLDVLEHVDEAQTEGPSAQATAAAEVARVLRISGVAVVSVPASGPWAWADSLNLYAALRRRSPRWLPLDPSEVASGASHRHFSEATLVGILDSAALAVTRSERTGTGVVPEILHLAILVVTRGILRSELWYQRLRGVYFGAHVLDDTIVIPRLGYSLTVLARRVTSSPSRAGQASHLGPHPPGRP
jgi:SAM-dependent methyltransferase